MRTFLKKGDKYLKVASELKFYQDPKSLKTGIEELDILIEATYQDITKPSGSGVHYIAPNVTHLTSLTVKKETSEPVENPESLALGVLHLRFLCKKFDQLAREAKKYKLDPQKSRSLNANPFRSAVKKIDVYFDSEGHFTGELLSDDAASRFASGTGYALYLKDKSRSGFWSSTGTAGADIQNAKLFQNLTQLNQYAKDFSSHAVVEVNLQFSRLMSSKNCDVSELELVKSQIEVRKIEESLKTPDLDELAHKLVGLTNIDEIKRVLSGENTVSPRKISKL